MSTVLPLDFFQNLLSYVLAGDRRELASWLPIPLIVYLPEHVLSLSSAHQLDRSLRKYRAGLLRAGVFRIDVRLIEHKSVSDHMESYLLEQRQLNKHGVSVGDVRFRYYVRHVHGMPSIEMIEQLDDTVGFANCLT